MSDNVIPFRHQNITVASADSPLIVQADPVVTVPEALQFVQGGQVVGIVDAKYDFSKCPPKYHALAIQVIQRHQPRLVYVALDEGCPSIPADKREYENMTLGYVGRFFRWLCGGGWK